MSRIKKQYSEDFKLKVAIEAMSGAKTMAQLCSEYSVHETQIKQMLAEFVYYYNNRPLSKLASGSQLRRHSGTQILMYIKYTPVFRSVCS